MSGRTEQPPIGSEDYQESRIIEGITRQLAAAIARVKGISDLKELDRFERERNGSFIDAAKILEWKDISREKQHEIEDTITAANGELIEEIDKRRTFLAEEERAIRQLEKEEKDACLEKILEKTKFFPQMEKGKDDDERQELAEWCLSALRRMPEGADVEEYLVRERSLPMLDSLMDDLSGRINSAMDGLEERIGKAVTDGAMTSEEDAVFQRELDVIHSSANESVKNEDVGGLQQALESLERLKTVVASALRDPVKEEPVVDRSVEAPSPDEPQEIEGELPVPARKTNRKSHPKSDEPKTSEAVPVADFESLYAFIRKKEFIAQKRPVLNDPQLNNPPRMSLTAEFVISRIEEERKRIAGLAGAGAELSPSFEEFLNGITSGNMRRDIRKSMAAELRMAVGRNAQEGDRDGMPIVAAAAEMENKDADPALPTGETEAELLSLYGEFEERMRAFDEKLEEACHGDRMMTEADCKDFRQRMEAAEQLADITKGKGDGVALEEAVRVADEIFQEFSNTLESARAGVGPDKHTTKAMEPGAQNINVPPQPIVAGDPPAEPPVTGAPVSKAAERLFLVPKTEWKDVVRPDDVKSEFAVRFFDIYGSVVGELRRRIREAGSDDAVLEDLLARVKGDTDKAEKTDTLFLTLKHVAKRAGIEWKDIGDDEQEKLRTMLKAERVAILDGFDALIAEKIATALGLEEVAADILDRITKADSPEALSGIGEEKPVKRGDREFLTRQFLDIPDKDVMTKANDNKTVGPGVFRMIKAGIIDANRKLRKEWDDRMNSFTPVKKEAKPDKYAHIEDADALFGLLEGLGEIAQRPPRGSTEELPPLPSDDVIAAIRAELDSYRRARESGATKSDSSRRFSYLLSSISPKGLSDAVRRVFSAEVGKVYAETDALLERERGMGVRLDFVRDFDGLRSLIQEWGHVESRKDKGSGAPKDPISDIEALAMIDGERDRIGKLNSSDENLSVQFSGFLGSLASRSLSKKMRELMMAELDERNRENESMAEALDGVQDFDGLYTLLQSFPVTWKQDGGDKSGNEAPEVPWKGSLLASPIRAEQKRIMESDEARVSLDVSFKMYLKSVRPAALVTKIKELFDTEIAIISERNQRIGLELEPIIKERKDALDASREAIRVVTYDTTNDVMGRAMKALADADVLLVEYREWIDEAMRHELGDRLKEVGMDERECDRTIEIWLKSKEAKELMASYGYDR